jgi:protein SCO1/2
VFVSVDPQRDTPDILASYVRYFDPDFVGVTGEPAQILALTGQLGIMYARTEGSGKDDYLIDHSAGIMLFDPDGKFHALFSAPQNPDRMVSDFLLIREYYEASR